MANEIEQILVCDCEGSVETSMNSVCAACPSGATVTAHTSLCNKQTDLLAAALGKGPVTIACTQEEARFQDIADEMEVGTLAGLLDIRDRALWSDEATDAAPKVAALFAEAARPGRATGSIDLESEGICLIYGAGEAALNAAQALADTLTVTLMLTDAGDIIPPWNANFEIVKGRIRRASGHLGAFEVVADGVAAAIPGGRGGLTFEDARDGGKSVCDLILDLSGNAPLFIAHGKRDGYLRADPADPLAVSAAVLEASGLIGTFEKTLYVNFHAELCAHSRSGQPGCTRCLDVCPTGAISPDGETVKINPMVCAGCGGCSAVCPSGAAEYALPVADDARMRMEAMLTAYTEAGGTQPRILIHDETDGRGAIAMAARYGRGLPARVIPFAVNQVTQTGHDLIMAAFGMGAGQVSIHLPTRVRREGEADVLDGQAALVRAMLEGVGQEPDRLVIIESDDPDALTEALYAEAPAALAHEPISPLGDKRTATRLSIGALKQSDEPFALPEGAPYGEVIVNTDSCTLCLACVSQCPAGALLDNPEKPQLGFRETACLQCGICANTCPENAITLAPRFNPADSARTSHVLYEDEPCLCLDCGKPFGSQGTVDRIIEKLGGKHWMFENPDRTRIIQLCDDCRVNAMFKQSDNPFQMGERPAVRRTEDYLDAREAGKPDPKRKFDA